MSHSPPSDPNQNPENSTPPEHQNTEIQLSEQPQSPKEKEKSGVWRKGAIALGILAVLGGGIWGGRQFLISRSDPPASAQQGQPGSQPTPVTLEELQPETLIDSSQFVGGLEAQERVVVRPEAQGRVREVLVESGDEVEAGTPLVQLRPERSEAELRSAQSDVEGAQSSLRTAESELESRRAQVREAESEVELQNEEYQRTEFLVEQGAQSQQQLDQAKRDRDAALSQLETRQRQVESAESQLEEARSALNRAESQVEVIQEDLEDRRIVAPIAGSVGNVNVKVGDVLQSGDEITSISKNEVLELNLRIPTEQAQRLQQGLPVQIQGSDTDESLPTGQISFISPQVDSGAQSVLAKASFPNPEGRLRDDQVVRARIIWEERTGTLVPTTAISRLGGQTFVFTADEEDGEMVARQRPVELGDIQGNKYQVISGVEPGETIITSGIMELRDGAPIVPESEMEDMEGPPQM
ncbi:efflux RND transporter periplasmic adaptor subunit [Euhalothece natronophila Z-M001]|uniref:Efflux RND transporter periplasmic adaptor subunit n=1 Tax=Euhalothece natronophila Z-M001 TaxID=522448 RepID=A0A5B8NQ45_9CHRO|nr:efflux RND transporter periplasmic adaptor subunit [Euhalothece natronophila]QDZ40300.1 efflux RND transporter periplasmic adaptor subunit [Euhalothece natronophila Z-M001]